MHRCLYNLHKATNANFFVPLFFLSTFPPRFCCRCCDAFPDAPPAYATASIDLLVSRPLTNTTTVNDNYFGKSSYCAHCNVRLQAEEEELTPCEPGTKDWEQERILVGIVAIRSEGVK